MANIISGLYETASSALNSADRAIKKAQSADSAYTSADRAWVDSSQNTTQVTDPYDSYGYSYGYGGYGGGGSSGKSPEETQEETQAQINNTIGNYAGRGRDLQNLGEQNLNNIREQIQQNNALYEQTQRENMKSIQWQPNQQKEQSTLAALRNRMGNAAYGSGLVDLAEGINRVDDMNDVSLIDAWRQNSNAAYNNWFQANEDLVADYVDQSTAIQDELSKLYSQYWSTMSNINPRLASAENILKSAKGEQSEFGEGTDRYVLPGGTSGLLASEDLQRLYGVVGADDKISGTQGTKDAWLKVNPAKISEALEGVPARASAINPDTKVYVRPDRAVNAALQIGNTGNANRSTAANRGFLDNLDAFRRRV